MIPSIDKEIQERLKEQFNPENSELRRAQLRMLELLQFLDKMCRKHNIRYWLDSGTLLGACRHSGFIPWDDDTDVCMPREDFLRFQELMLSNNPSNEFVLQCHKTDSNFYESHMVLRDLKSEYLQNSNVHNIRKYRGLQVDIFPLEDRVSTSLFLMCRSLKYRLITVPLVKHNSIVNRILAKFFYYAIESTVIPLCRFFTLYKKNSYYKTSYGCFFNCKLYLDTIYPLSEIEFEGYKFLSPHDADGYLRSLYGNWQEIPPLDKIHTHNVRIVFYDK